MAVRGPPRSSPLGRPSPSVGPSRAASATAGGTSSSDSDVRTAPGPWRPTGIFGAPARAGGQMEWGIDDSDDDSDDDLDGELCRVGRACPGPSAPSTPHPTHTHARTHARTHTHIHTHTHARTHARTRTCTHMPPHTHTRASPAAQCGAMRRNAAQYAPRRNAAQHAPRCVTACDSSWPGSRPPRGDFPSDRNRGATDRPTAMFRP